MQTARERLFRSLIASIPGEDVDREGLINTPKRIDKLYNEIFAGYQQDPYKILGTVFREDKHQEMVIVKDIAFYSHCEHHLVPFFGRAHIGYIPQGKVVGLSKLIRLVKCFTKRLQIQERLTSQIADTIQEVLQPLGTGVIIEAEHLCISMRGVNTPGTKTITSAMRGVMLDNNNNARVEFLDLIKFQ